MLTTLRRFGEAVRLSLIPRESSFYELFASSANNLVVGAKLLSELLGAPQEDHPGIGERMRAAEHASDEITHEIMQEVNSTFVTPFDREDIYRLASSLDDVMDAMDAAVDLVVLYQLGELPAELADQVEVLERAAEVTAEAMPRLRGMSHLSEYWIEINRLENQADQTYRRLLAQLFSGRYDALTVLKLKDVVDELEAAADAFEHVANTVESIAVKES
jgi:predicted phosphate transport protein (TIGR00153 family)